MAGDVILTQEQAQQIREALGTAVER